MPYVRQTNFSGGEVAPGLWGRTDLELFGRSLRRCRNFFLSKQGAAVSRPGTTYIGSTPTNAGVRLVPFVYSDDDAYVLVFGNNTIQFIYQGEFLETALGSGVRLSVATTYDSSQLPTLRWTQSGDVLTITHPGHTPRELARVAHRSWTLTDIDFDRSDSGLTPKIDLASQTEDAANGLIKREWQWMVTSITRDARGVITESAPTRITLDDTGSTLSDRILLASSRPAIIEFATVFADPTVDPNFIAYRVYRGRGGLYGWVGDSVVSTFTDVGQEPDYTLAPPQGRNPFKIYDSAGNLTRTERPTAVTYFEERLVFGGTANRPAFVFLSATGDYRNFDERLIVAADQALMYELASRRREDVRHLLGLGRLLLFTGASVWSLGGARGDPLTPDSVQARVELDIGCTLVPPLSIDGTALFVRNKGVGVRALAYDDRRQGFGSVDVSAAAQHLFSPAGLELAPNSAFDPVSAGELLSWAYAEDPWSVVWAVRADGSLLSLTYSPDEQLWAWARHDTDGYFLDVCSIPEDDEDAVYVVTSRAISGSSAAFSVERMTSRVRRDTTEDDIALDCAVEVSGVPALTLTGLGIFAGRDDVYVIGKDNPPRGPFTVSAAGEITLEDLPTANDGANAVLYAGLLFQPELEPLDIASSEVRTKQKNVVAVAFEVDNSRGLHVGQDFDHLVEWRQRTVAAGYSAISAATELVNVAVKGKWDGSARAALRQTLPLPVTILGITREVAVGE